MIGKLKGIVDSLRQDSLILDVNGVGYHIYCSGKTMAQLEPGSAVAMFIETHVREDHIHLFGFLTAEEQQWFNLLATVQGVGAKVDMAILSALTPGEIAQAVAIGDVKSLTRANGVGQKLAQRLVTELKDKVGGIETSIAITSTKIAARPAGVFEDALSALVNLGYARGDAFRALAEVRGKSGDDVPLNAIIPLALKELA